MNYLYHTTKNRVNYRLQTFSEVAQVNFVLIMFLLNGKVILKLISNIINKSINESAFFTKFVTDNLFENNN